MVLYNVTKNKNQVTINLDSKLPHMLNVVVRDFNEKLQKELGYHFGSLRNGMVVEMTFCKSRGKELKTLTPADDSENVKVRQMCVQHIAEYHDDPFPVVKLSVELC